MTATQELPTLTRLGKMKRSPLDFIYGISTRLQSPESFHGYPAESLAVDNSSFSNSIYNVAQSVGNVWVSSNPINSQYPNIIATRTTGSTVLARTGAATVEAMFLNKDPLEDFVLKPRYTSEFKIRVKSFRIDKSLPKIFTD